jgi:MFS transporter, UMF1 family
MSQPGETLIAAEAGASEVQAEGTAANRPGQWAWALYEGARDPNVIFQLFIIAPFLSGAMLHDDLRGQKLWGDTVLYAGIAAAFLSPFFGAIADRGGPRKPWLALFTVLMVASFAATWFGAPNASSTQIFIFCFALVINNIVFELSNAFHGAMLSRIAPPSRIGGLSGLAFALGSGSGFLLMLLFLVLFILPHPLVHLAPNVAERLSGPISALWMLVFAVPLFLFTPDRPRSGIPLRQAIRDGIVAVLSTFRRLKHYSNVAHYIGARTLFNDGLTGVLNFGGIYAAGIFHLDTLALVVYGLLNVFFGTLGGLFGGWLDDKFGSKIALLVSVGGAAFSFGLGLTMAPDRLFWFFPIDPHAPSILPVPFLDTWPQLAYAACSSLSALFVVGAYANNRTMLARIAPAEKMTEFFGLMSLSGTAATFLAPMSVVLATTWTHSQRGGMVPVVVLLLLGWLWMFKVREERATAA